jgi:hypothetical protein
MDPENFFYPISKSPLEHQGNFLISKYEKNISSENENLLCCY